MEQEKILKQQQRLATKLNKVYQGLIGEVYSRPWGEYLLIAENEPCTVKVMTLLPEERLSVQVHRKRDQIYIALSSELLVTYVPLNAFDYTERTRSKSQRPFPLKESLKTFWESTEKISRNLKLFGRELFNVGTIHTIRNASTSTEAKFLDIAFGENDENDIIRIEDKYGRT